MAVAPDGSPVAVHLTLSSRVSPSRGPRRVDSVSIRLADVDHSVPGVLRATMIYEAAGGTYRQAFVAHEVDDGPLDAMATRAGLRVVGFLDEDRAPGWCCAAAEPQL